MPPLLFIVMPFCKRTILPKDVCKPGGWRRHQEAQQQQRRATLEDLVDVCGFTLGSLLRQLSDLSRHSVSILEELEGDLATICHRSCALEGRVVRLQRRVTDLISKPPPRGRSYLKRVLTRLECVDVVGGKGGGWSNFMESIPKHADACVCCVQRWRKSGNFWAIRLFLFLFWSFLGSPDAPEGSTSWVWGVECVLSQSVFFFFFLSKLPLETCPSAS